MKFEKNMASLEQRIFNAFADVPYPKDVLAPHECDECSGVRRAFTNQIWKSIDAKIIEENYDKLPLFSGEAFHYFLPAYLLYSLDNFGDNDVCEFTIYALSPDKNSLGESFDYWTDKFQNFTDEQMEIIYDFLNLVSEDENLDFGNYKKEIERLKKLREVSKKN